MARKHEEPLEFPMVRTRDDEDERFLIVPVGTDEAGNPIYGFPDEVGDYTTAEPLSGEDLGDVVDDVMEYPDDERQTEIVTTSPYVEGSTDDIVAGTAKYHPTSWWESYKAKKTTQTTFWGGQGREYEGARGLSAWLGGYGSYDYGYSGSHTKTRPISQDLVETLKFAKSIAGMLGKDKITQFTWQGAANQEENQDLRTGRIVLDPEPVKAIHSRITGKSGTDLLTAQSVAAGYALHDVGHTQFTPAEQWEQFGQLPYTNIAFQGLSAQTAIGIASIIEDGYVEAETLKKYPGYRSYLSEGWNWRNSEKELTEQLKAALASWDMEAALPLIADQSRRYQDLPEKLQKLYDQLPEDARRLLQMARGITDRAHTPGLTMERRRELAADLANLLRKGEPPPEDQGGEGGEGGEGQPPVAPPSGGDGALESAAQQAQDDGRMDKGPEGNSNQFELTDSEAHEAHAEEAEERERTVNVWPNPPEGAREAPVTWYTPVIEAGYRYMYERAYARVKHLVPQVAKALSFRQNTPRRNLHFQLRGQLDERHLADTMAALGNGGRPRPYMNREVLSAPRAGVDLLVDDSGSMSTDDRSGKAREAAVLLAHALDVVAQQFPDAIKYKIRSHTSDYHNDWNAQVDRLLDSDRHRDYYRLGNIHAKRNNFDGEALKAVIEEGDKLWPDRQRVVFFINDGLPCGAGYGRGEAERRVQEVVTHARRRGITVLTIYLGEMSNHYHYADVATSLEHMYGPKGKGWVHVPRVRDLPQVLAKGLTKALEWKA